MCLQLMTKLELTASLLAFIDMNPSNDMQVFFMERTGKFLDVIVRSVVLCSLRQAKSSFQQRHI